MFADFQVRQTTGTTVTFGRQPANWAGMKIILDATGLDSCHRTRGIGRYVQGLTAGFSALHAAGEMGDIDLQLLRQTGREQRPDDADLPFATVEYERRLNGSAAWMHLENHFRLDGVLPKDSALFHATSMEGVTRRMPWVATCHDLIPLLLRGKYLRPWALRERAFWSQYVRLLQESATHVIAISNHTRQTLIEYAKIPEKRISVAYHGLSPFWFEEADTPEVSPRARQQVAAGPYVLFVGGFDERKRFRVLTQAMAMLPADLRPRLLVAGKRSDHDKSDHGRLRHLRDIDCTFLEYVSDVDLRFFYRQSICLAFPSIEEGWGFPIVEAMAAGTPVVCARHGSMVEAAGGAGIGVDVRRAEDVSHGIRLCVESESIRAGHVAAGRARAAKLQWSDTARSVLQTYRIALTA